MKKITNSSSLLIVQFFVVCYLCLLTTSVCEGEGVKKGKNGLLTIEDVPHEKWKELNEKKIYFGHQSVGYNIMNGALDVVSHYPKINLNIVETNDTADFNDPIFAHSTIGHNEKPESKINDFRKILESGVGKSANIAFFKFCYIDINLNTDVDLLFREYKRVMSFLESKYSHIIFVYVTIPLRTVQSGPKAWVKRLLRKPVGGYFDNIKRHQFNEMMRKEYKENELFDLAKFESENFKIKATFKKNGVEYPCLISSFTDDGKHLNKKGRKVVAEQLLLFLVNLQSSEVNSNEI